MKSNHYVAILAILNAMLFCFSKPSVQAGEGKGGTSHTGGRASSHMSSKGLENTNAQWSADPERGWVRVEERQDLHEQRPSVGKSHHNGGKYKGNSPRDKAVRGSGK